MKKLITAIWITMGSMVLFSSVAQAQGPTAASMTVTNDTTIHWLWATQYMVNASASLNGTVVGDTNVWIDQGSNATVEANADSNYHFVYWTGVPEAVTNLNPASFAVDTFYTNITAYFALDMKTVTVTTPYGIAAPGTTNVLYGTVLNQHVAPETVTITPGRVRVRVKNVQVDGNDYTVSP